MNKTGKTIFLIASFLIPTFLFANYVLNQFYIDGSGLLDVGWFKYMMTEANSWPLPNPQALESTHLGSTFFHTHFSLFFYILSFLYKYFLFFIPKPVYYSLFIGSMYGLISFSVFLVGLKLSPFTTLKYIIFIFVIAIFTSLNGVGMGLIGFPHIEIAIPAFILLFLALYFTGYKIMSYMAFLFLLSIREDAGFHIFALLSTVILFTFIIKKDYRVLDYKLLFLGMIGILYSLIAIYIQKTYFPGDSALERVYLGSPHFAHLTASFLMGKLKFILENREYIYVPMLFTILMSLYTKNIFLLTTLISTFPWAIFSIIAISAMPSSFSNYYAFPFILILAWPVFAFLIAESNGVLGNNHFRKLVVSIIFITGSSVILFPNNKGNFDNTPWQKLYFNNYKSILKTEIFITNFEKYKIRLGNILLDEPMAALLTKNMLLKEYGYLDNYSEKLKKQAETIVFYISDTPLNRKGIQTMNSIIISNKLKNICQLDNTNIVIATNKNNVLEKICR